MLHYSTPGSQSPAPGTRPPGRGAVAERGHTPGLGENDLPLRPGDCLLSTGSEVTSTLGRVGVSPGLGDTEANENTATDQAARARRYQEWRGTITSDEDLQVHRFREHRDNLEGKHTLLTGRDDPGVAKIGHQADNSRYFQEGRRRITGKLFHQLGRWYNCPAMLVTLTYDQKRLTRAEAWHQVGADQRRFINQVNQWRARQGWPKAKFLGVREAHPKSGYPHVHLVLPNLKYLAPIPFLNEVWGQGNNAVDLKRRDQMSPVSYICKYVTDLKGWTDLAQSYIWIEGTRLYSMSRDYVLPDYSEERVAEWDFRSSLTEAGVRDVIVTGQYHTILGADEIVARMLAERGFS